MTRAAAATSRIMASVPNANTAPERALRSALHRRGLRYCLHRRMLGTPDITFVSRRVAVFVDGDYWHGNAWRTRGFQDFDSYYRRGANGTFWAEKIQRNMRRDDVVSAGLRADGWHVVRVWETDLKADLDGVADRIEDIVRGRVE
jgi:DNA mismatch endonuclease (patch repair protein)